jgi:hypothetical protein|tara:strand:- start:186 stop:386 length:201 start_codon:yes stop_codon:yes gene_type:complete
MELISTYWRDSDNSTAKVYKKVDEKCTIQYYSNLGVLLGSESFPDKTLRYHEDAAENWALGIKLTP